MTTVRPPFPLWGALFLTIAVPTACTEGLDGRDGPYDLLLDYTIDRPRVMGLSMWPMVVHSGETVTLEALGATPDHLLDARVEWWGCGVTFDKPVQNIYSDCYNTDLVEYLGEGTTFSLNLPDYDLSGCQDEYSCYSSAPLFAVVKGESGRSSDEGYAVTAVVPDFSGTAVVPSNDLYTAPVTFQVGAGNPVVISSNASPPVSAPAPVAPGSEVALEARVETHTDYDLYFTWYTSVGELEQFGLTRADPVEVGQEGLPNVIHGRNTLRIPEDFEGSSIAIYLVIDVVTPYVDGYSFTGFTAERFVTGKVEVKP